MKKAFKIIGYLLAGLILILLCAYIFFYIRWQNTSTENMALLGEKAPRLTIEGHTFRDLNKNGQLDAYEDERAPMETRITDLLGQMTLEEKAGLMFINMIVMGAEGELHEIPSLFDPLTIMMETNSTYIARKKMNHFNSIQSTSAKAMAIWHNEIQTLAERTRLGIPVTLASDPRHSAVENIGASIPTPFFSKWCSPLGFAAIGDMTLMKAFGDIARQEYTALGIRLALSPMADLATEPRWCRVNGTFGEDAALSARLTKAYIDGFQGDSLGPSSVACMTKHFPGGGPQKDGEDAHFPYGVEQVYPGNHFDYHLIPFEKGAFAANTAQIMPYYGIPVGQTDEEVAFAFNKAIITGLLREKYQFDGVVCTDWGLIRDSFAKPASAWGVEHLSEVERVVKALDAGCDMFGGDANPEWILEAVQSGKVNESRIDTSARRILRDKFRLGLFDNPYLDIEKIAIIGNPEFIAKGREAQRKSLVLLKNEANILPLKKDAKVYVQGIDGEIAKNFAQITSRPEDADYIILKLYTPFEPRDEYFLESFFRQGRLDFPADEKAEILSLIESKPTITVMAIDRPPVIPGINAKTKALIADFACEDAVILELIFGQFQPTGRLPIELPASAAAVAAQKEDVPYDSENPLYPFGYGLSY